MHKSITLAATAAGALLSGFLGLGADHPKVSIYKAPEQHGPARKTLYTRHKGVPNERINYGAHPTFGLRQRTRFAARMDAKVMARTDAMAVRRAKELGRKKAKRA